MLDAETAASSSNPHVVALARGYARWAETRGGNAEEVLALMDDDIVMESILPAELPNPLSGTHSRKDQARAYFATLIEEWEMLDWRVDSFIVDEDGDDVVVVGQCHWRNRGSGAEVRSPKVDMWHFEDGRATRFYEMFDTLAFAKGAGLI
jgi:ketosteroid isomerase-like protein